MKRNYFITGSVTAAQLADFLNQVDSGNITGEHLEDILNQRNPFTPRPSDNGLSAEEQFEHWISFFSKVFKLVIDPLSVNVPIAAEGFNRLIVVPAGISVEQVLEACMDRFRVYDDDMRELIKRPLKDDRLATHSYAVWVRGETEAREFPNRSAKQTDEQKILGITLLERLLYELKFFVETHAHLDKHCITLCTGSCWREDSETPVVHWHNDLWDPQDLRIRAYANNESYPNISTRQVSL